MSQPHLDDVAPVVGESLTSQIYARVRADILSGALPPGRKLKIEALRAQYEIGASPLREALSRLSSERLVERLDQRGFRVAATTRSEFEELLATRCWLEERALRESIARGDSTWEEAIVIAYHRLSRQPRSHDAKQFVASRDWEVLHKEFHNALISACGSAILLRFCDDLYDQNIRYRQLAGPMAYPGRDVNREHENIMKATLDRNADLAIDRLTEHYGRTGAFLAERFD